MRHNLGAEQRSAVATTIDSFKERSQRSEHYLIQICVLFPSLAPVNGFVLTVLILQYLAEKYNRSYRPYLLGQRGAASLNQYFGMQQMLPQLENKQVVYVISPQWFSKMAMSQQPFSSILMETS